jgi:phage gp36-like protein
MELFNFLKTNPDSNMLVRALVKRYAEDILADVTDMTNEQKFDSIMELLDAGYLKIHHYVEDDSFEIRTVK